jgi:hypothetical protein
MESRDQSEDTPVEESDSSTVSGRRTQWPVLERRGLLRLVSVVGVTGLAGCSQVGDFFDGDDAGESTPTFGYGGTSTAETSATPTATRTRRATDTASPTPSSTRTRSSTATSTPTRTGTQTPVPEDDYGEQGYGEYGYGGAL